MDLGNNRVYVSEMAEKMGLTLVNKEVDISNIEILTPEINRPALQLHGYFEYFEYERVQIIGYVEHTYIQGIEKTERIRRYEKLLSYDIPCLIYSTLTKPDEEMVEIATRNKIPIFVTERKTSEAMAEIIRWLNVQLAPCIAIHGVLVDVYGEGVLIMGESGIGKSEAALELLRRGHRLVADDVVEIRKVSEETLIGSAPEITKNFMELRGIGIIDVKALFGVECVKLTQSIDLVIKLEEWNAEKSYDRFGVDDNYTEFLGNRVVCHSIPIRPGRNLAIIVECAAANHRQKKMGYNAAETLYEKIRRHMMQNKAKAKADQEKKEEEQNDQKVS